MNCSTTPIYGLHPEIISLIFEKAKNMTDENPQFYSDDRDSVHNIAFEFTSTRICSAFRQIALGTPKLWTSIHVHRASHLDSLVEMLALSGSCWLDIRIDLAGQDPQMSAIKLEFFIANILQHHLRWRSLCIGYSCEQKEHSVVMQLCSTSAPGLRQLSITVDDVAGIDANEAQINRAVELPHIFKDGTPKLGFIRLRGFAVQLFRPPLSTVTTLHLDHTTSVPIHYSTLNDILTTSPHLAHLSMYGDILILGGWNNKKKAISLPSLRSLRVCSISGDMFSGILNSIDAPNLECLLMKNLQTHDLDTLWDATSSESIFETLRSLSFVEFNLSTSTCKHIFRTFQQITTFSMLGESTAARGSPPIINVLSEAAVEDLNGRQYVPWPRLKTLCLGSDFYEEDSETIDMLLLMRKENGCTISTVIFVTDAERIDDLISLKSEAGANVEFKFCSKRDVLWPEDGTHIDHDDILFL